jgi:hypothetical protein
MTFMLHAAAVLGCLSLFVTGFTAFLIAADNATRKEQR